MPTYRTVATLSLAGRSRDRVETTPVLWKGKLLRFESVRGGYGQEPNCSTCGLGKRTRLRNLAIAPVRYASAAPAGKNAPADAEAPTSFAGDPAMKSSYYRFRDVASPLAITASFAP